MKPGIYDLNDNFILSYDDSDFNPKFAILTTDLKIVLGKSSDFFRSHKESFSINPFIKEIVITSSYSYSFPGCEIDKITIDLEEDAFIVSNHVFVEHPEAEIISKSKSAYIENGCLISKFKTNGITEKVLLFATKDASENLVLPNDIVAMAPYTFEANEKVKTVSGNVTKLYMNAFSDSFVEHFDFPKLNTIGPQAFYNSKITDKTLTINSETVDLSYDSFQGSNFTDIYILAKKIIGKEKMFPPGENVKRTIYVNGKENTEEAHKIFVSYNVKEMTLDKLLDSTETLTGINDILKNIEFEK